MQLPKTVLMALLASPIAVFAQASGNFNNFQNPFNVPANFAAKAGTPFELNWTPTTSGTISLVLRSGASSNLVEGTVIATGIANGGTYTWTPSEEITRGSDYTIEIIDDTNPSNTNFSHYFVLDSPNTVAYSTSQVSLGAPSSSIAVATASNTLTVTPSAVSTASNSVAPSISVASGTSSMAASVLSGTQTGSSVSSAISSANSVASSQASAGSASLSSATRSGMTTSQTGSSSSSSGSSSSQTGALASATSSVLAQTGGAPRATAAAAGLMGLVAFGAMAL